MLPARVISDHSVLRSLPTPGRFFFQNIEFFHFLYSVVHHIIRQIKHFKENLPSSSKVTALIWPMLVFYAAFWKLIKTSKQLGNSLKTVPLFWDKYPSHFSGRFFVRSKTVIKIAYLSEGINRSLKKVKV